MIEEQDFDFAAVLGIDNARAAVDAVFDRQSTARPDQPDMAFGKREADAGVHQPLAAGRNNRVAGGPQVGSRIAGVGVGGGEPSRHPANGLIFTGNR